MEKLETEKWREILDNSGPESLEFLKDSVKLGKQVYASQWFRTGVINKERLLSWLICEEVMEDGGIEWDGQQWIRRVSQKKEEEQEKETVKLTPSNWFTEWRDEKPKKEESRHIIPVVERKRDVGRCISAPIREGAGDTLCELLEGMQGLDLRGSAVIKTEEEPKEVSLDLPSEYIYQEAKRQATDLDEKLILYHSADCVISRKYEKQTEQPIFGEPGNETPGPSKNYYYCILEMSALTGLPNLEKVVVRGRSTEAWAEEVIPEGPRLFQNCVPDERRMIISLNGTVPDHEMKDVRILLTTWGEMTFQMTDLKGSPVFDFMILPQTRCDCIQETGPHFYKSLSVWRK